MAPQTAISKAVCYKTKNEQLWEKAVHFLLVATNWFYAISPTVFCTITHFKTKRANLTGPRVEMIFRKFTTL
jgi:hypothetical protein